MCYDPSKLFIELANDIVSIFNNANTEYYEIDESSKTLIERLLNDSK